MQEIPLCENTTAVIPVLYGNYVTALQRFKSIKKNGFMHLSVLLQTEHCPRSLHPFVWQNKAVVISICWSSYFQMHNAYTELCCPWGGWLRSQEEVPNALQVQSSIKVYGVNTWDKFAPVCRNVH